MTEGSTFRLEELLGTDRGCGFLSREELERWVEGRLDPERGEAFETHAPGCPDCQELLHDLEQYRELSARGLTVASEREAFEAADPAMRRSLGLSRPGRGGSGFLRLASWLVPVAALVLLIWLWPSGPSNPLVAELELPPFVPPGPTRGLDLHEVWDRAGAAWNAGDLATARDVLARGVADHPEENDLRFYLGVAELHLGQAGRAVKELSEVDRRQADLPSELTRFMLAMALDRDGRRDEACDALRSVVALDGRRAERARELIATGCAKR